MSDGGMRNKQVFHVIDAKAHLSFDKQGNKNHRAIGGSLKMQHMIDRQKIAAQIFGAYWASFFYQSAYSLQQRRICSV
jgi:hypothetical protein